MRGRRKQRSDHGRDKHDAHGFPVGGIVVSVQASAARISFRQTEEHAHHDPEGWLIRRLDDRTCRAASTRARSAGEACLFVRVHIPPDVWPRNCPPEIETDEWRTPVDGEQPCRRQPFVVMTSWLPAASISLCATTSALSVLRLKSPRCLGRAAFGGCFSEMPPNAVACADCS
jgi:hypothetical protein